MITELITMENKKIEQRNNPRPLWQPTQEELDREKQIIIHEPMPEPDPVITEGDNSNNEQQ